MHYTSCGICCQQNFLKYEEKRGGVGFFVFDINDTPRRNDMYVGERRMSVNVEIMSIKTRSEDK